MEPVLILPCFAVILFAGTVVVFYNRLVKARNQLREGWSGIEVQLKRRHELVPALVECVKGYRAHEEELLEAVARERTVAQSARGVSEAGVAEKALARDLGRIVALVEAYPDLKADEVFFGLMKDLVEVEAQLQYARRYYNGSVRDLNNIVESLSCHDRTN